MGSLCMKPQVLEVGISPPLASFNPTAYTQTHLQYNWAYKVALNEEQLHLLIQFAYPFGNDDGTSHLETSIKPLLKLLSQKLKKNLSIIYHKKTYNNLSNFSREVLSLICLQDALEYYKGFYIDAEELTLFIPKINTFTNIEELKTMSESSNDLKEAYRKGLNKFNEDESHIELKDFELTLLYHVKCALFENQPSKFAENIASWLFRIHKVGFAHDDIKMDNCVYDVAKKQWLLIDFDISSPLGTYWGYRGTPGYFATSGPSSRYRDFMHALLLLSRLSPTNDCVVKQEKLDLFEFNRENRNIKYIEDEYKSLLCLFASS